MRMRTTSDVINQRHKLVPRPFDGSARESDERRILSGFLESDEFGLGGGQPLRLQ